MKCNKCGKETTIVCHTCGKGICAEHAYHMRKYFYCLECFLKERKKGLIISWSMIAILVVFGIITILIAKGK